jgi:hypothetical protein
MIVASRINKASSAAFPAKTTNIFFAKPFSDKSRCATHSGIDMDSGSRAVLRAGAALHARIEIDNPSFVLPDGKDLVGTYLPTPAASNAGLRIQLQSGHIAYIAKTFHKFSVSVIGTFPPRQLARWQ